MKKIFYFAMPLMLFTAVIYGSCSSKDSKQATLSKVAVTEDEAEIKFDTLSHDYGKILLDTLTSYDFVFHNIGATTLHIKSVEVSCSCTKVQWPKGGIEPGESAVITAIYDTHNRRPGYFQKSIRIYSNAKTSFCRLNISGEVISDKEKQ